MRCGRLIHPICMASIVALLSACISEPPPPPRKKAAVSHSVRSVTVAKPSASAPATPPVSLVGMNERQLVALLGPPTSEHEEAPGKAWRYRRGQCTIDVTLYPDV